MKTSSVAFLSYAHRDDEYHGGAISVAIGEDFHIFQDRKDVAWGKHWPSKLKEGLAGSRFLIAILSPSFFKSDYCRNELTEFLEIERLSGRNDLVLPIYYVTTPFLENPVRREGDTLANAISQRQYRDWRDLRHEPFSEPKVRRKLDSLAQELMLALERSLLDAEQVRRPRKLETSTSLDFPSLVNLFRINRKPLLHGWLHGRGKLVDFQPGLIVLEKGDPFLTERRQEIAALLKNWTGRPWQIVESDMEGEASLTDQEEKKRQRFQSGNIFRDIDEPWCPEMVVIPTGSFIMGSGDKEEYYKEEKPEHRVRLMKPFALGRYPIKFDEFDHFCIETGREKPGDKGWGRGRRPVIHVNVDDAASYLDWLSEVTGQSYRLPSEAEWEYACRAGTITPFWNGETISTDEANYNGTASRSIGGKGGFRMQSTETDFFPPNPFGLCDMHGNIAEWCADHWHESYVGAPTDGSAWLNNETDGKCVLRGGSWLKTIQLQRSASRGPASADTKTDTIGFRCARIIE